MNLERVAQVIEDADLGTRGTDIFVNHMPAECQQGILLRQPFGGSEIDHELPGYRKTEFMMIVRAKTYGAGSALAQAVMAALTMGVVELLNDQDEVEMHVNYMRPRNEPLTYAPSIAGVTEFLVNIDACYVIV